MNFKETAERAIAEAKKELANGCTIDMGSDVKAGGITGYMARQIDGAAIDGDVAASTTLQFAAREIQKRGTHKKQLCQEAWDALMMIEAAREEMGLNGDEEE